MKYVAVCNYEEFKQDLHSPFRIVFYYFPLRYYIKAHNEKQALQKAFGDIIHMVNALGIGYGWHAETESCNVYAVDDLFDEVMRSYTDIRVFRLKGIADPLRELA